MRFAFAHKMVAYLFAGLGLIALMLGTTFTPVGSLLLIAAFLVFLFALPLGTEIGNGPLWPV